MRPTLFLIPLTALLSPVALANDLTILKSSLAILRKGGPGALKEAKPGSSADIAAMKTDLALTRWETRLAAAEWLLLAHLQRASQDPAMDSAQAADLNRAWLLIDAATKGSNEMVNTSGKLNLYRGTDAASRMASAQALSAAIQVQEIPKQYKQALLGISIEVAVRLRDAQKMARSTALINDPADLATDRDRTFALIACAHGGRFGLAGKLHSALSAQGRILPAFHNSAISDQEAVDFAAFGEWARASQTADTSPAGDARSPITSLRLRLKEVRHTDPAQAQRIKAGFPEGWQASGPFDAPLIRQGALAHWLKPGTTPIPMAGVWSESRISLGGFLENPTGRRWESLELTPDAARPGLWVGSLTASQGAVVLVLDAELELAKH